MAARRRANGERKWMLGGGLLLVVLVVLAAIPHHPSTSERATDLRSLVSQLSTDIRSCAGGLTDSLIAMHAIQSGSSRDVHTATGIATEAAANCSPANSMDVEDLVQVQVPESLASFRLDGAVNGLVTWARVDAVQVCGDIASVIADSTAATRSQLKADEGALDRQGASFSQMISAASQRLAAHVAPPSLPS